MFGTGLGIAFFKWVTDRTGNVSAIRVVSEKVVLADWLFTLPVIIVQALTGLALARLLGSGGMDPDSDAQPRSGFRAGRAPGAVRIPRVRAHVVLVGRAGLCRRCPRALDHGRKAGTLKASGLAEPGAEVGRGRPAKSNGSVRNLGLIHINRCKIKFAKTIGGKAQCLLRIEQIIASRGSEGVTPRQSRLDR